jgi:TonB family protein
MATPPAHRRGRRGWEALAAAALINAGLVVVLDHIIVYDDPRVRVTAPPAATGPALPLAPAATVPDLASASMVGLVSVSPPALPLEAILGVGDVASWDPESPARPRSVDLPGARAADRGGGAEGGTAAWTERRDRASDAALRSRIWTSPDAYRSPRTAGRGRARSPEAINRDDAAYGDRAPATQARDGAVAASVGDTTGPGAPGLPVLAAVAAPDATTGLPGASAPARVDGAPQATREAAYVDRGAPAVDVLKKGATSDDRAVAAASNQRRVDPFDLTPPRSGGDHDGEGVAGRDAPGMVADGWARPGTAAARADVAAGDGDASTFATRQDPSFVELFRRLDRSIEYPRDLAIQMVSGRVVAIITLRADGTMAGIAVHAGSGHAAFDAQLTGALRRVGKLPPVPRALLEGRSELRVMIPYTFRSPMIH